MGKGENYLFYYSETIVALGLKAGFKNSTKLVYEVK